MRWDDKIHTWITKGSPLLKVNSKVLSEGIETSPTAIITLPLNIDEREYGISSLDIKFKREYFGPVNIDRVKVSLLDDKGNILNLNGRDWFFSIKANELYQF